MNPQPPKMTMTTAAPVETTQPNRAILRLALALLVLGGLYVGLATFLSGHVPSNTRVDRIAVGGMSPDEATSTLTRVLATRPTRPVQLHTPTRTFDIDPGTAGIEFDLEATLSELTGFTLNPVQMWAHLTGGDDQPLKVRVDRAKLTAAVTEVSKLIDTPAKEGSVTFTGGRATTVLPVAGQTVDVADTTQAVVSTWPDSPVVEAAMNALQPKVSPAEFTRIATEFAVPAMSAPVKVVAGGPPMLVRPAQYAPALSVVADGDGKLAPKIDSAKILAVLRATNSGVERAPVDASVRLVGTMPKVVPAVVGTKLDDVDAPETFLAALTSPERTATLKVVMTQPAVTTAIARGWGIKQEISTFHTHLPSTTAPRTDNIRIAVRTLNGQIVRPGAQFSLNAALGERTAAKGYQQAQVIYAGRLIKDFGGGVSQVSTTTFNAAFFAGVRIDKYTPHTFYISRYPEGREATVSWPDVDQKWTNDLGFGILISSYVKGSEIYVTFYGTKVWDIESVKGPRRNVVEPESIVDPRPECQTQSPTPGFDVTVTRIFKKNGVQVRTSVFNTHYAPEAKVTCTNAG